MEAVLDGLSSLLVLWRFKLGKRRDFADAAAAAAAKEARDARRERQSAVGIGGTFVAAAVMLCGMAARRSEAFGAETLKAFGALSS